MSIHTKVWAHRGAPACAPENTMPAFKLAARMGADGFETDVQLTADGELVLCHDDTVDRVSTGSGPVCGKTLPELLGLDFCNGMPGFHDVRIPRLSQLLAFVKKNGRFLNLEMKYSGSRWDEANGRAADLVRRFGLENRVLFSSFKPEPLLRLKKLTAAKVGLLFSDPLEKPWELAAQKGFDSLNPYFPLAERQNMPEMCRRAGVALCPWAVDDPSDLRKCYRADVDAVITNRPDVAVSLRRQLNGRVGLQ